MQLNLARKWRSQSFEHIVGQELVVRILKNTLFLNKFFPVYLLAGQHGCGKTTTGRVFAAAINCALLPDFQHNPQSTIIPCGSCSSCCAMKMGKHPDFIEIDAASHTGVDNVRQLIDAATLVPLMGRKKIYLIDEAHMLSKAAFNAFLKMLEEPGEHVLFLLATTDDHKIIDTVKSRCFQLFFQAVTFDVLCDRLKYICQQEAIDYDDDGLTLIVKQSQGSVRDALNLTEQVFLSERRVGKTDVFRVVGAARDEIIHELFTNLFHATSEQDFVQKIDLMHLENFNAEYVWRQLLEALQHSVWIKCGVHAGAEHAWCGQAIRSASLESLMALFSWWCTQEPLFLRTVNKTVFLQYFLLRAWLDLHGASVVPSSVEPKSMSRTRDIVSHDESPSLMSVQKSAEQPIKSVNGAAVDVPQTHTPGAEPSVAQPSASAWLAFIQKLEEIQEPLLVSIFKQATVLSMSEQCVHVQFSQRLIFLKDTLEQAKERWKVLFEQQFGAGIQLQYQFVEQHAGGQPKTQEIPPKQKGAGAHAAIAYNAPAREQKLPKASTIDISDKDRWPLTHALLEYFPGRVMPVSDPVVAAKKQVEHDDYNQE